MAITGNHSSDDNQSRRHASSPWNQVVLVESETVVDALSSSSVVTAVVEPYSSDDVTVDESSCSAESSDNSGANSGGSVRRPAWSKASSNGAASSEVRPLVMDAVSWPLLSASARASTKVELSLSNGLLDGSSSVPQFQGTGSKPSSSQRQVSGNASVNNMVPTRHKLFKHNSSNSSTNDGHQKQSAPQVSTAATESHNSYPRDRTQRSGFVSNDHQQQRNSYRNRNGGPHQRGNDAHHHSYGNRRGQEWNTHRNFNGRETHIPPSAVPRFIRPPPNSAQFIHSPPMRPFGSPAGFPELAPAVVFVPGPPPPPDSLTGVSFMPQMPPLFFTGPDPQLHAKVVNQIDYYFSNENLVKDTFLRQNMDSQGWVPIKLIAGFNKVLQLTDSIQLILDAVWTSSVVELQGDKLRRRNDWRRWIMPPSVQLPNDTGSQTLETLNHDVLAEQVQNIALESTNYDGVGGLDAVHDASQHRPSLGNLNNPLQFPTREVSGQVGNQDSDHSISARN
ncbi:putative winged helix-turn-helix DNA-binding domain-containing protein [Lupinus albus]|uniref:Putative winged helix-turn-helix DNA-binding domain-containing protein n=1 Tax=Lupinus albus TaxID=3870 RepID=A0A6A4P7P9_LUPAL|nr:putative winged helix-turn-helix DNA-binding domain-containing protein [Lupinus albus]